MPVGGLNGGWMGITKTYNSIPQYVDKSITAVGDIGSSFAGGFSSALTYGALAVGGIVLVLVVVYFLKK